MVIYSLHYIRLLLPDAKGTCVGAGSQRDDLNLLIWLPAQKVVDQAIDAFCADIGAYSESLISFLIPKTEEDGIPRFMMGCLMIGSWLGGHAPNSSAKSSFWIHPVTTALSLETLASESVSWMSLSLSWNVGAPGPAPPRPLPLPLLAPRPPPRPRSVNKFGISEADMALNR